MSRLTDLASKATARPWAYALGSGQNVCTLILHENPDTGETEWIADCLPNWMLREETPENHPPADHRNNLNLIVALVNRVDDIQRLWDAADACIPEPPFERPAASRVRSLAAAVEALRDLLGGDDAEDD